MPGRKTRKQELSASLSLNAPPKKVDDVAAGVLKTTNRYGGVVMRSDVSSTSGADFDLRIPADRLQPALAALSELGDVESRNQTSTDITAAFVSPRERLTDGLAERKSLLSQLAKADTPNETSSIRQRLRLVSQQIAVARGELRGLQERANYAKVHRQREPARDRRRRGRGLGHRRRARRRPAHPRVDARRADRRASRSPCRSSSSAASPGPGPGWSGAGAASTRSTA